MGSPGLGISTSGGVVGDIVIGVNVGAATLGICKLIAVFLILFGFIAALTSISIIGSWISLLFTKPYLNEVNPNLLDVLADIIFELVDNNEYFELSGDVFLTKISLSLS